MDTITPEQWSKIMSRIRSKDTKPEMLVRNHLHALGFRYRLHSSKLPGHPDIVLPKWHTVIFVNGCFWHRHEGCKVATMPKSNVEFWQTKFERNVTRDKKEHATLEPAGWHVVVTLGMQSSSKITFACGRNQDFFQMRSLAMSEHEHITEKPMQQSLGSLKK